MVYILSKKKKKKSPNLDSFSFISNTAKTGIKNSERLLLVYVRKSSTCCTIKT
jgi:hypothetical protein